MGAVDTELMRAPRLRPKPQTIVRHLLINGDSFTTIVIINHLSWAVIKVGAQRQRDSAFLRNILRQGLAQDGDIALAYLVFGKLLLKVVVSFEGLGNDHQSTRCHVEAMNDEGRFIVRIALLHQGLYTHALALPGYREHAGRLTDDTNVVILIDDLQLGCKSLILLLTLQRIGIDIDPLQHPMKDRLAFTIAGRIEL